MRIRRWMRNGSPERITLVWLAGRLLRKPVKDQF